MAINNAHFIVIFQLLHPHPTGAAHPGPHHLEPAEPGDGRRRVRGAVPGERLAAALRGHVEAGRGRPPDRGGAEADARQQPHHEHAPLHAQDQGPGMGIETESAVMMMMPRKACRGLRVWGTVAQLKKTSTYGDISTCNICMFGKLNP